MEVFAKTIRSTRKQYIHHTNFHSTIQVHEHYKTQETKNTKKKPTENTVACMPLIRRVLGRMIGFINRWLHTHS
jgi:hypothetical protein